MQNSPATIKLCIMNSFCRLGMIGGDCTSHLLNSAIESKEQSVCCQPLGCNCPEQGVKLLGLLLTGSTGQHMAGRNGLA
jgi:hypothetical protein